MRASLAFRSYVRRWAWLAANAVSLCASAASPEVSQLIAKFQEEESGFVDHVEIANEIAKVATLGDVSSLESWLAHEDRRVRGNAAYLFAKLGDRRGLATIEGILTDYSADRHLESRGALIVEGNFHEAGVWYMQRSDALRAQIRSDRYYAVHLLGELRDPRAVDTLVPLLGDDEINYKVAWALGEIGDARAIPELIVALSNKDALVRVCAIGALERLRALQALPYLTALFTDPAVPHAGDQVSVALTAREAADAIRRGRVPMGNMVGNLATVVLLYGSWATSLVLLWLFGRALANHRQTSFLLLLVSTLCGLSYAGSMSLAPRNLLAAGETSTWYAVLQTFLLLAQMVLGVWGTAILLRDYRKQADRNTARSENDRGA